MNADNDTFLTALLDGELDAEQQSRVESAVAADARLSEHLRDLTAVRDLVAGLSRPPAPFDASMAILERIERGGVFPIGPWFATISTTRFAGVATLTAAAAALVVCALVGVRSLDRGRQGHHDILAGPQRPVAAPVLQVVSTSTSPDPAPSAEPVVEPLPEPIPAIAPPTLVGGDDDKARKLFENSRLDRVLVVTDVIGGLAEKQVGEILKTTARHSTRSTFSRIVVRQGIMIDPERPGKAVVFAVVMNEAERNEFQKKLGNAFPGGVEESTPRPDLVAKLADIGEISLIRGTAVAELKPLRTLREEELSASKGGVKPAERIVGKESRPGTPDLDPLQDPGHRLPGHETELVVVPREKSTPEQLRSGPHPSVRDRNNTREPQTTAPEPVQTAVAAVMTRPPESLLIVWVISSAKRGRGLP